MDVVRVIVCGVQVLVIMMVLCVLQTAATRESFTVPPPTCPSETVTFTCTVNDPNHHNGGRLGTTYWQVGNSRPCALPHADPEIIKECGPGNAFVVRLTSSSGSYYTSILQVTAHPSLNGTRVRCYVPDGRRAERTVGIGTLEVIETPPTPSFLPPNEGDFEVLEGSVNVTVRWSEPQDYRHTANITSYNITADCTMPSQGRSWVETLTVQDNQKMMIFPVGIVATLTVHADVCDSLVSNESKALEFCIEVPLPVLHCSATVVYNGSSTEIVVTWYQAEVPCHQNLIAPGLSGNVRSYTISINKQTVEQECICTTDSVQCSYTRNVAGHEMTNYTVAVAANNVIGQSDTVYCTATLVVLEGESRPAEVIQEAVTMLSTATPSTGSAVNSLPPLAVVVPGVIIGVIVLLAVIGVLIYFRYRKKKKISCNTENNMSGPEQAEQRGDIRMCGIKDGEKSGEKNIGEDESPFNTWNGADRSPLEPQDSQATSCNSFMGPEQAEQRGDIRLCKKNDGERSGEENIDGDGSSEDDESDKPMSKNVVWSRVFNRSQSAPHKSKSDTDPSTSLLPNTVGDIDPSQSLPLKTMNADADPTRSLTSSILAILLPNTEAVGRREQAPHPQ